jgi:hypothetical protein
MGACCIEVGNAERSCRRDVDQSSASPVCGVAEAGDIRTALARGFRVAQHRLRRVSEDTSGVFVFDLPPRAEVVSCGLFVCAPEFGTASIADEVGAIQIVNADRCLFSVTSFPVSLARPDDTQVEFSLDELKNYGTDANVPTLLATGCWATSGSAILAASELSRLDPAEVPLYQGVSPRAHDSCGREAGPCVSSATLPVFSACDAGASCPVLDDCDSGLCERIRTLDTFGVCLDGVCRMPCLSADDCGPGAGVSSHCSMEDSTRTSRWFRSAAFGVCGGLRAN